MKVLIDLNKEVLEFFKERSEKNNRSRKSEIEMALHIMAFNESLKEDVEKYKPVIIKPLRVTIESLPKVSKADQLRKLRGFR